MREPGRKFAGSENLNPFDVSTYRELFDPSPMPVWLDHADRIVYINPACLKLLGTRSGQDVLGRSPLEIIHPDDHQQVRARIAEGIDSGCPVPPLRQHLRRLDGTTLEVEVTAWPVSFGGGTAMFVSVADLTERRQVEGSLRGERQHLRDVLDSIFAFVGVLTPEGILIEANRAPLEAAGIRFEDVAGKLFPDTYWWSHSTEAREQLWEAIRKAQHGEASRYDVAVRMKGDSLITIDFMLRPMRDGSGRIQYLIPSGVDVTQRVEAAEALQRSEQHLRATFDNAAVGIAHVDEEGRWLMVNDRLLEILGFSRQELLAGTFQQITHPEDLDADLQMLASLRDGRIPSYTLEKRYLHKNGSVVWASLTVSAVRNVDGTIANYISIIQDISARKAAEEALAHSQTDFLALANSVPQLVWMADPDGFIFWYNRRWFEYTGTKPEDMQGWGWKSVHDPETLPEVMTRWSKSLATGEPLDMTFPLRGADGISRPFLTRVLPVKDDRGNVLRWVGTNTDVSEQRATEDALRGANQELEQFAFVASHDLQEPLRTVNIYSELLLRRFGSLTDPDAREFARYLQGGVRRMQTLIRDLLDYSRVIHSESLPAASPVDLADVFSELKALFRLQIEQGGARINVGLMASVLADYRQLLQLFQNLLANALKYKKAEEPARVDIHASRNGDEVIIAVRDWGIGFDQQYADRIFGLFKRLHSDNYEGAGLGLAICKRIVERQGGRIWAESRVNEGSTFYVALPAARSDESAGKP